MLGLEPNPRSEPRVRTLASAEDALARLDERLASSPIADAVRARSHFVDAAAALSLEGELVHFEDLVLHDAAADIHAPTHALTRAHAALRARRRIAAAKPGWSASVQSLDELRGVAPRHVSPSHEIPPVLKDPVTVEDHALTTELAAMDALLVRTRRVLDGQPSQPASGLAGTVAKDQLEDWLDRLKATRIDPPVLAAARAGAALDELAPLPQQAWLGHLVIADLLRARGKTRHHLAALDLGLKIATRENWRLRTDREALWIAAITAAAETGLRDHDRLLNAYRGLQRKLAGRRSHSKLPALVELVMRAPVVSTRTIATELKVTPRAAQDMVAALALRELTGRTRYRCWGVL